MSRSGETTVQQDAPLTISNTVGLIGVILAGVSVSLVILLFVLAAQQPKEIDQFREHLQVDTPAQLRLLIVGFSAAILNLVSVFLCVLGLFLPNRPRLLAAVGTGISVVVLLGVFGVAIAGAVLNPPSAAPQSRQN